MTESVSLAHAKAHLSEVVGSVAKYQERVTVTVHGQPSAVILSPDEVDALEETIAVLADSDLMRQISRSQDELSAGLGETEDDLTAAMAARARS